MLRPEPSLIQRWDFRGWNGTPRQLADAAMAINGLLPNGDFRAEVTRVGVSVQVADQPEGLGEIAVETRFDYIQITIGERRNSKETLGGDSFRIVVRFGNSGYENYAVCQSPDEIQSRAMLERVKDAVRAGVPWHVRISRGWILLPGGLIGAILVGLGAPF
jgi:hypothetical protein